MSLPHLRSAREQVVKVFSETHKRQRNTHVTSPHTYTQVWNLQHTAPLCFKKRTVNAQGAEQDGGAEGVNFNLIKWVRLLISYGNICYGETMTLW